MVRIRLRRVGGKKQPSYRIVVADARAPRDGRFIEVIGNFNPRTEPETVKIEEARALYWLSVGAQPSDAVVRLMKKQGTLARAERLKQGESLEELVAEAENALQVSDETRLEAVQEPAEPVAQESAPEETEQESDSALAAPEPDSETEPVEAGDEDDAGEV